MTMFGLEFSLLISAPFVPALFLKNLEFLMFRLKYTLFVIYLFIKKVDGDAYLNSLQSTLANMKPVFDASQKKVVPWIDVGKFASKVLKKSSCVIS
jgi:hypothetical protein